MHWIRQSINQSNPVLLKERVRIPRTCRAGGAAMLWGRLPLDGVGSCRLFFTDDLHDNLSWVPASDKPHTFKSCFTHSSQVFFGQLLLDKDIAISIVLFITILQTNKRYHVCQDRFMKFKMNRYHSKSDEIHVGLRVTFSTKTLSRRPVAIYFCT